MRNDVRLRTRDSCSARRRSRRRARAHPGACTPGSRAARASWRASWRADATSRPSSTAAHRDLQRRFAERTQALEARNEELTRLRFALETANRRLKHLVGVDALTGIANRRHFDRALEREVRRARRDAQPLSLVFLDLDEFKLFNDSYGHTRGDEVLRKVAQTLDETFRRGGDLVARYGGEEFAVVLPGVDGRRAGLYAERLRRRIWRLAIPYNASQLTDRVTISGGVATVYPPADRQRPTTCCSRRTRLCTARNAWAATASPPAEVQSAQHAVQSA